MTYDISLFAPGREGDRPSDELPPLQVTDDQLAAWRRIVARVQEEVGTATEDRYPTHLELWLHDPVMQLCYEGSSASVEVPYRYTMTPASAHTAIATAYALARIVADETGMRGHDYEVNQPIQTADLSRAVARYRGVGHRVRALVEEHDQTGGPAA